MILFCVYIGDFKVPFHSPFLCNYNELLVTYFTSAFTEILEGQAMPPDHLHAIITVIPKLGKDVLHCASYRPISLLNCDLKLFPKILVERLGTILQHIVPLDQVGFIQNERNPRQYDQDHKNNSQG